STDKVDTEVPSPISGTLKSIKIGEDETVAVGTVLAEIEPAGDTSGQPTATPPAAEPSSAEPAEPSAAAPSIAEPTAPPPSTAAPSAAAPTAPPPSRADFEKTEPSVAGNGGRDSGVISPLVRRMLRERGISISEIRGTGPGGRVRRED